MNKLILIFSLLFTQVIYSQTGILQGYVTGSNGDSLSYANVVIYTVNGMVDGTQADIHGKYVIRKIPAGTYIIRFSRVGFETQTARDIVIEKDKTTYLDAILNGPLELNGINVSTDKKVKRKKGEKN